MKKTILVGTLSFLLGATLTVSVIANPFEWEWLHHAGHWLLGESRKRAPGESTTELWTCSMHPEVLQGEPGNCSICKMKLVQVEASSEPESTTANQLWTCGMHPQVLQDEPGSCPICGMNLTPVKAATHEEGEATSPGIIRIDPVFVQNIGVRSEAIRRTDIPFTIRTVGTLAYNDAQIAWVNTKFEGWIEKVYVNYVGEPVKKGQKLFEIYSPQLVTTQKEYLQALDYAQRMAEGDYPEIAERARSLQESARERLTYWDITAEQIAELERIGEPRRTLTVVSPAAGLVVEKMDQALEGMYAKTGMNLYKLVDLSTIWVEVEVFENQVPWLKVGQKALIEIPYEPGKEFTGRVRHLYPYFNDKTRTLKVSIELANPGQKLRAEMYANVTFDVPSAVGVLAVPEESVIHSGARNVVVLDQGNGTFQVKEVSLGVNGSGLWEVRDGLKDGDQVVISSQFLIDSESNFQEAIQKMNSGTSDQGAESENLSGLDQHQH